jgi:hypothetical protein
LNENSKHKISDEKINSVFLNGPQNEIKEFIFASDLLKK